MKKHKIVAVTGIRSEYELLYSVLKEIESRNNLDTWCRRDGCAQLGKLRKHHSGYQG